MTHKTRFQNIYVYFINKITIGSKAKWLPVDLINLYSDRFSITCKELDGYIVI
jgi:hypothetical protein